MSKRFSHQKSSGERARVQPLRMQFLRLSKYAMIAICLVGALNAANTFFDHMNAREIGMASDTEFWAMAETITIEKASVVELDAIAKKALEVRPRYQEVAELANNEILRKRKQCLDCEIRIAYLEEYKNNRLTDVAQTALSRSYELSPYGKLNIMKWRLEVSERHWDDLGADLQKAALSQITAIAEQEDAHSWLLSLETETSQISERIERLPMSSNDGVR